MSKSPNRFVWTYNPDTLTAKVVDQLTKDSETFSAKDLTQEMRAHHEVYGMGKKLQDGESGTAPDHKMAGFRKAWKEKH